METLTKKTSQELLKEKVLNFLKTINIKDDLSLEDYDRHEPTTWERTQYLEYKVDNVEIEIEVTGYYDIELDVYGESDDVILGSYEIIDIYVGIDGDEIGLNYNEAQALLSEEYKPIVETKYTANFQVIFKATSDLKAIAIMDKVYSQFTDIESETWQNGLYADINHIDKREVI